MTLRDQQGAGALHPILLLYWDINYFYDKQRVIWKQCKCKQYTHYCEDTCIYTIVLAVCHFSIIIKHSYIVSSLSGSIPKLSQQLLEKSTQEFGMWYLLLSFNFCCFCGSTSFDVLLILCKNQNYSIIIYILSHIQ